jgi:hypothetical protein
MDIDKYRRPKDTEKEHRRRNREENTEFIIPGPPSPSTFQPKGTL